MYILFDRKALHVCINLLHNLGHCIKSEVRNINLAPLPVERTLVEPNYWQT